MSPAGIGNHQSATAVADLLAEEVRLLGSFVELLHQERQLLQDGTVDALPALAERKSALAGQLADLNGQREKQLAAAGLGSGRPAMEAWLATGPAHRTKWQKLLELADLARNLNETNGKLVAILMQNNQQALATLLAAGGQLVTYGPDGQQTGGGGGRSFGSV